LPWRARANFLDRFMAHRLLAMIGAPHIRLRLWDGAEFPAGQNPARPLVWFKDRKAFYTALRRPELNWGDLYGAGRIEVEGDLPTLLERVYLGLERDRPQRRLSKTLALLQGQRRRNTRRRAADNIHYHYDIGNDFYALWLDTEAMQYTCAYYPDPAMSLEQAQLAKLHHVCRKLQLRPGDTVIEAGCGWGGLARFMARHYGARVKAYNISREQIRFAREKAREEGLSDRVEYVLDDYRNISGHCDVFVSVGMLEHVGPRHYGTLGQVVRQCLKPGGRGLVHSIGRNRPKPLNPWIERRIFPGAYPPTLREAMAIFEPNGLSVLDVENLRLHYALTLRDWLQRYEQHFDEVCAMLDEPFARAWRLYLAGSMAAFTTGQLQLFQFLVTHEANNALPWSRAHLYDGAAASITGE
jgi:cyclopropane-fatty-acyl-phospholipid synthase